MTTRRGVGAGLMASLLVAACGGRRASPVPVDAAVTRANFTDADPHDWGHGGPAAHVVHGIDVARWQTAIDWHRARANGVNFAFVKATEGGDGLNPEFQKQWHGAAAAGVPRGAYHFYYFCTPAEEQARWFIRNVPRQPGALPPVVDLEWNPHSPTCTYRPPAETVRREARIFSDIVARHYGQRPILYIPIDFYHRNDMEHLGHEEFWLRSVAAHPSEKFPGAGWSFWQYSGTGRVPGIAGNVDLNAFAGSRAQWARWLTQRMQA